MPQKCLRIFYLITELDVGGAEKTLFELATRLDPQRFLPVVGCLFGRGEIGRRLAARGVEVVYFDMRGKADWRVVGRVAAELRRREIDLLHTFLFHANLVGRLAAWRAGVRAVVSSVRVEERRRLHLWGDRLTRGLVDVETCVSESTRDYTHRRARVPMHKLAVVPNGIDVRLYEDLTSPPPAWRLPADAPLVVTVARVDTQKDPETMIEAFAILRERFPGATLAWAGEGPLADEARGMADRPGLRGAVRFLGRLEDVRPLLGAADAFALASRWEGMPNSVLEAMAAGLPVVATAVGGCPEMVVEGETGLLVPPGDARALADAIAWILADPARARRMGEAGRARAQKLFSHDAMVAANEAIYERLLSTDAAT